MIESAWRNLSDAMAVVLLLVACSNGPADISGLPVREAHGDDFQELTLDALIDRSDLIVSGVVDGLALSEDIEPAPELEDFGGEANLVVSLDPDNVLRGEFDVDRTLEVEIYGVALDDNGEPEAVYALNGMPVPSVGSTEVWFLVEIAPGVYAFVDVDDARFSRSGDTLTALAETAGPAGRRVSQLGFRGLVDRLK